MALALALPALSSTVRRTRVQHRRARYEHTVSYRARQRRAHDERMVDYRARHRVRYRRAALVSAETPRETPIALTRIRFVPPLRGSRASLLRQNERDDAEGLVRIADDAQLDEFEEEGKLVPVPASMGLRVNAALPMDRRYCRPWTARFLADLARSHFQRFGRPLQVNSAVRTIAFQRHLELINGNAAPAEGDLASPHLTGAAVDIGKRGMSFQEIAWMRAWLLPLEMAGKIDVEEEFEQACFHIDVYQNYVHAPATTPRRHRATTTLLAAQVP